jgi:hypothetical protein
VVINKMRIRKLGRLEEEIRLLGAFGGVFHEEARNPFP